MVAVVAGPVGAAMALDADAVRETVDEVLSDSRFQTEFPDSVHEKTSEVSPDPVAKPANRDVSPLWEILTWVAIAAAGAIVAYIVLQGLADRLRIAGGTGAVVGEAAGRPPADATPDDAVNLAGADRLAAMGDYVAAIRVLLLMSLELFTHDKNPRQTAMRTNRELLRDETLPESIRPALKVIIATEELGQFGGRRLTADLYATCRDHYRHVAAGLKTT